MLPSRCAVCHSWPTHPVCDACVRRFAQVQARCERCAIPMAGGSRVCGACLIHPPPLNACLAAVPYAFPWSGLIASFKFHQHPGLARPLAKLMRSAPWVEAALEQADWVLPVPLSSQRLRSRGYNQARELARCLLNRASQHKLRADLLLRITDTVPQPGLQRAERLRNVAKAFAANPLRAGELAGRRVVLVDDVMTSGASLFSAAACLRLAGVDHITGVVLARTDAPNSDDNQP